MTLMEEKTLADHDINVKSIRQELRLLEEQLHGRNEPQPSPTVTNEDTVSRKAAIKAIRDTYRVLYPIDMISKDDAADVLNDLPPSPSRPQGQWIHVPVANGLDKYRCDQCGHYRTSGEDKNFCPNCGADMRGGAV